MTDTPVLDELLDPLRAEYHARRQKALLRVEPIEQALQRYTLAVELEMARELATAHGLKQPQGSSGVGEAARALLTAVQALPELVAPAEPSAATTTKKLVLAKLPPVPSPSQEAWPQLTRALIKNPLVVVGGVSAQGRSRFLPKAMSSQIEWVDTRHQGTHAIGNLEKRIRERRVVGLILVEGLVQHRHTDPLISAARAAKVPCAFAGKGGNLAIKLAIDEIEKLLGDSSATAT
jgi:hypothetical protein